MNRQIKFYLVARDTGPDLPVRFTGLDLDDYSGIVMRIRYQQGGILEKTVEPDMEDPELGWITWEVGDLLEGVHQAEFEFTETGGEVFTIPRQFPILLEVRKDLG